MRFRSFLLCAGLCAAAGFAALAQQAQEPASYPHDMSEYGCTNRDENTCDSAPAPPPDYNPLVGTWVRYSLLRNGFSVQPPDAPLYVKFMNDGYWSMMEFPADRPKVEQAARAADDEGAVLALRQDGRRLGQLQQQRPGELSPSQSRPRARRRREHAGARVEVRGQHPRARRLRPDALAADSRAQTAESDARLDGAGRLVGAHGVYGERRRRHDDARASAARRRRLVPRDDLPAGRKGVPKVPQDQWTPEQYAGAYNGMSASRGTYNVRAARSCAAISATPIRISKTS